MCSSHILKINYDKHLDGLLNSKLTKKEDFIKIILEVILLLSVKSIPKKDRLGKFELELIHNRLYFRTEENDPDYPNDYRIFSFYFPFKVNDLPNSQLKQISLNNDLFISSHHITFLKNIINEGILGDARELYTFDSELPELINNINREKFNFPKSDIEDISNIMYELLLFELGYIRFDNDLKNFNEGTHPLNHVDIFHTDQATFKLKTDEKFETNDLRILLDNKDKTKICRCIV